MPLLHSGKGRHMSCCQIASLRFCHGYTPWARWQKPKGCIHSKSAAVAASARQVRSLEPSRRLSRPPWVGSTWSMVWNVDYRTARSSPTNPADSGRNAKSGFLSTLFVEFPGNASNFVGSAGSTLFEEFPGNAAKNVQKKVPEWGPEKSSRIGRPGWGWPGCPVIDIPDH